MASIVNRRMLFLGYVFTCQIYKTESRMGIENFRLFKTERDGGLVKFQKEYGQHTEYPDEENLIVESHKSNLFDVFPCIVRYELSPMTKNAMGIFTVLSVLINETTHPRFQIDANPLDNWKDVLVVANLRTKLNKVH